MFFLYTIKDSIQVKPESLDKKNFPQFIKLIQDRYLFKIIQKIGICVQVINYEIVQARILQQEGDLQVSLQVVLMIFKSYKDEILEGTILKNTSKGIIISLQFTEAFVPGEYLNKGAYFDNEQQIWIWNYEEFKALYYENQQIRFKTQSILLEFQNTPQQFMIIGRSNQDGLGLNKWWNI